MNQENKEVLRLKPNGMLITRAGISADSTDLREAIAKDVLDEIGQMSLWEKLKLLFSN